MAIKRVWRLPILTHSNLIPFVARVMPPEFIFAKRSILFIQSMLNSSNATVKTIAGMGRYGRHSVLGLNVRHLTALYNLNVNFVKFKWKTICQESYDIAATGEQIRELCYI